MQAPAAIGKLEHTLRRLIEVPRRAAVIAAPQITRELQREFAAGRDPYGVAWAKLRPSTLRKHGPPPLTDSRTLRDGTRAIVARANYAGIRVQLGAMYGYFAQVGFRVGKTRVPPRRVLPSRGLPAAWRNILVQAAKRAAREAARG